MPSGPVLPRSRSPDRFGEVRLMGMAVPYVAPLCPAGHLPHTGGDRPAALISPIVYDAGKAAPPELPISPFEGEMSGRTEGDATGRRAIRSFRCPSGEGRAPA